MGKTTETTPVAVHMYPDPVEKKVDAFTVEKSGTEQEPTVTITVGNGTGPALALAGGVKVEKKKNSKGVACLFFSAGDSGFYILADSADGLEAGEGVEHDGDKLVRAENVSALDAGWAAFVEALASGQATDGSSVVLKLAGASAVTRDRAKEIIAHRLAK